jgi:hypothetical protein
LPVFELTHLSCVSILRYAVKQHLEDGFMSCVPLHPASFEKTAVLQMLSAYRRGASFARTAATLA